MRLQQVRFLKKLVDDGAVFRRVGVLYPLDDYQVVPP